MFDNPLVWIGIVAAIAIVGSIIGLLINSGGPEQSAPEEPEKYRITLHLGGGETRVFEVDNYDYGDGELILYFGDDRQIVVSGAYTAERIRPVKVSLAKGGTTQAADASYKFTLYENGVAVKEYLLTDYSTGDTEVTLNVCGLDDEVIADGCYVIEPMQLSPASDVHYAQTGDDDERFKVQLFQAGRVVREIMASSYESANGVITLYPVDCQDAVIFRGTFVVEPIT
jgi:hypothetical protein